jgi:hypothetical protein
MMIMYGDVNRMGEKGVWELFEHVPGNIEENCNELQIGCHPI